MHLYILSFDAIWLKNIILSSFDRRGGPVVEQISRMREIGVPSPVGTDKKKDQKNMRKVYDDDNEDDDRQRTHFDQESSP